MMSKTQAEHAPPVEGQVPIWRQAGARPQRKTDVWRWRSWRWRQPLHYQYKTRTTNVKVRGVGDVTLKGGRTRMRVPYVCRRRFPLVSNSRAVCTGNVLRAMSRARLDASTPTVAST
jgi:hypothetical protein